MHGVPTDLDLSALEGAELIQVCLGFNDVQFHFRPIGHISVVGRWEFFDDAGVSADHGMESEARPPYQLHRLLGENIVQITLAPEAIDLRFGNGDRLRLNDDSEQYESFTIDLQPHGPFIVV
jgi:hypothetical protein